MTEVLWETDVGRWILGKIPILDKRAKYCADNSLRFLIWAKQFENVAPPVASFCALHAVEEAVAAFISAAKACGHNERAKDVNIHDHLSKALVSILAQRSSKAVSQGRLAIAVHPTQDCLVYRLPKGDDYIYSDLHLSAFYIDFDGTAEIGERNFLGQIPLLEDIGAEVRKVADARNAVIYASDEGTPTGFLDIEKEVRRAAGLSLGLIWGCVDLYSDEAHGGTFVQVVLDKMIELNRARKKVPRTQQ